MNIVVFNPVTGSGLFETWLELYLTALCKEGHQIHLISAPLPASSHKLCSDLGVPIYSYLPATSYPKLRELLVVLITKFLPECEESPYTFKMFRKDLFGFRHAQRIFKTNQISIQGKLFGTVVSFSKLFGPKAKNINALYISLMGELLLARDAKIIVSHVRNHNIQFDFLFHTYLERYNTFLKLKILVNLKNA